MRERQSPTKIPHPLRAPYFRATVQEASYVLRTPSLYSASKLLRDSVPQTTLGKLMMLADPEARSNFMMMLHASPEVCELFGLVIGICWADPLVEIEATLPQPVDGNAISAYGSAVFEELHAEGWTLVDIATIALSIVDHLVEANKIDDAVTERAAFFLRPPDTATPSVSPSSASTSDPSEGDGSPN